MRANMIPKAMPRVYRWMLTASSVVFVVYAIEDGRGLVWGPIEQGVMLLAGLSVAWVAWKPSKKMNVVAGYLATIAVLFEAAALVMSRNTYRSPWITAVTIWIVFGAYTVALISFEWIRRPPR